ncbi:MAG: DUF5317 domain-containing protein [Bacillota bacterium]|nr:DUF5317 domain-containing protein [Candidatus Fermentithermobacillaceae bacterium]
MYASALLVAVALALVMGGDLRKIASLEIERLTWIAVSFALPLAAPLALRAGLDVNVTAAIVTVLSYGMLFYGLAANMRLPGIAVIGLGSLANLVALAANSFRMPVRLDLFDPAMRAQEAARLAESLTHVPLDATTNLTFLSDVIPWRLFGGRPSMVSIGDILIALGIAYLAFRSVKPRCLR